MHTVHYTLTQTTEGLGSTALCFPLGEQLTFLARDSELYYLRKGGKATPNVTWNQSCSVFSVFCIQSEESGNESDDSDGIRKPKRLTDEAIVKRQERRKWDENRSVGL